MQPMAAAEVALKSPLIPLFQRGNYSIAVLTPLWKRGEGEISTRRYGNHLFQDTSKALKVSALSWARVNAGNEQRSGVGQSDFSSSSISKIAPCRCLL